MRYTCRVLPIHLRGARTNNLKNIDLTLVPGQAVCLCGPSGAGKSSLALDTLYAEGQRRFIESFSPYARQFLERLERPPVDSLAPIAAAVAVDRRAPVKSSRSTLATLTDLEPYLSALFASEALPQCPDCRIPAEQISIATFAQRLAAELAGELLHVAFPLPPGESIAVAQARLLQEGFRRLLHIPTPTAHGNGESPGAAQPPQIFDLETTLPPSLQPRATYVLVERLRVDAEECSRLQEALELCVSRAGSALMLVPARPRSSSHRPPILFTPGLRCPGCQRTFAAPHARLFSYNSPLGACPACRGFGRIIDIDWDKVIPDARLTLRGGAIRAWNGRSSEWERAALVRFAKAHGIPLDVPWQDLTPVQQAAVLDGEGSWDDGRYPGVRAWFKFLESRTYKMHVRVLLSRYRAYVPCSTCGGDRLCTDALRYHVAHLSLADWHRLTVRAALERMDALGSAAPVLGSNRIVRDALRSRLRYLTTVGLGYLTLDRPARTLSGGEAQRANLTTALGAGLTGSLFVLDEPSVGLHKSDVAQLGIGLRELADAGNAVLMISHELSLIGRSDRVIELGPHAGQQGGRILFDGTPHDLWQRDDLPTPRALHAQVQSPRLPRPAARTLALRGVQVHNLRHVDVDIPLGVLCAVAGPSGSGKSTLCEEVLYRAVARACGQRDIERPGAHRTLRGHEGLRAAVLVDQSPLGRTARGNPATYTKAWDRLRARFAAEPDAQFHGLTAAHFSFNLRDGRCSACDGEGYETVEMQFLADVSFRCPLCQGKRFVPQVLAVRHGGLSVAEILDLSVGEVLARYSPPSDPDKALRRSLEPLVRVGLGYLPLGQPLSTLSGGEAQRLKLARALAETSKKTLFVIDEPSAGLHPGDIREVIAALHHLVEGGASVVVVEHDLQILAASDWIIDMGPGGGPEGGRVVACGTPAQLAASGTRTGDALRDAFPRLLSPSAPASSDRRAADRAAPTVAASRSPDVSPSAPAPAIVIERASEHNLKSVSCRIPHAALTVVTGPSGSGKSSLAFDVLFAEGQRRFLETLSPYARQFLPTLPRPHVDRVEGVPPSIALEQRTARAGANSTVATVTEVAHYLRLLFAKVGTPHCPTCALPMGGATPAELLARLHALAPAPPTLLGRGAGRTRGSPAEYTIYAPAVRARKGVYGDLLAAAARDGIVRARIDGKLLLLGSDTDLPPLSRTREHSIDLVMYCGAPNAIDATLLSRALALGEGCIRVAPGAPTSTPTADEQLWSTARACPRCGQGVPDLDPRWFSFNTAQGQCERCLGAGVVVDERKSAARSSPASTRRGSRDTTKKGRPDRGDRDAGGPSPALDPNLPTVRCPSCEGTRLAAIPRQVRLGCEGPGTDSTSFAHTYSQICDLDVERALHVCRSLRFVGPAAAIAEAPLAELLRRLAFIEQIGLGYLQLGRPASTLSGGELQRLRLSAQLGSGLTGALYVLDEPTIGLHPRDTGRLLGTLRALVDTGCTVVCVEHDEDTIRAADHLIDLGPSGGREGGQILASGAAGAVLQYPASPTGQALRAGPIVPQPAAAKPTAWITLHGACAHNLRRVDLRIPVGRLCVVAGPSGSGKSTLVQKTLYPAVRQALNLATAPALPFDSLSGIDALRRAIAVDQSPIGRTPRSVPATFLGVWDEVRRLYASLPDAKARGFANGRFSFNSAQGGRCPLCEGQGAVISEMSFLPDVATPCEACAGARFEPGTLEVRYRGMTVADVLRMSAAEAAAFFAHHPRISRPLRTLCDLGVGYVQLGQGSHTLSGGEAQRLKLASELTAGTLHEPTLYVLDEPTTGLHLHDVRRLLSVLHQLVARGDTLVVVEHHLDVIAAADWVVELGPEAGHAGGEIVFAGPPADLSHTATATGRCLGQRLRPRAATGDSQAAPLAPPDDSDREPAPDPRYSDRAASRRKKASSTSSIT